MFAAWHENWGSNSVETDANVPRTQRETHLSDPVSTPSRPERDTLLALYVPAAIMAFCQGLILPVLPLFALSFDASYAMVGVILAAQGLGNLVSDLPVGVAIRRLGRKRVMLTGGALVTFSVLALVWAEGLYQVIACRFISGIGMAMWGIARHAFLAEAIGVRQRGRASAVMGGMMRITAFAAPFPGGLIAEYAGLRVPFAVYAGLSVFAFLAVARWVAPDGTRGAAETVHESGGRLVALLRSHYPILMAAGSGALFGQMIRAGRNAIIPLYGAQVLGLDASSVGLVISVSYGVDMLMFYPAGMVMDRFGRKFAYVPSFTIQAIGMALIPLTSGLPGLMAAVVVIGLGNGIGAGTMLTLGSDLAPRDARGEFLGIWRFIGDSGHAGGPLAVGRVADLIGLGTTPYVVALFGLLGAGIFLLFVPETLRKTPT